MAGILFGVDVPASTKQRSARRIETPSRIAKIRSILLQPNRDPHGGLKRAVNRSGDNAHGVFNQTEIRTAD